MGSSVAYIVADGSEPVEVVSPVDVLRRGGVDATLVSIMGRREVKLGQGLNLMADALVEDVNLFQDFQMIVIPGGSEGVDNLGKCEAVCNDLRARMREDRLVASICAGPTILAKLGLLDGRKAVCYPGCETVFPAGVYQKGLDVCVDGNLITATGPGLALPFGKMLLHVLKSEKDANDVASGMLF